MKIAVIVSHFNEEVTLGLLAGAQKTLRESGVSHDERDVFHAPGAFEIPLLAQTLARTGLYDGVVCLGCVIKGDTAHFEFISLGATLGLQQAMLATEVPITFGILTTYTDEQALVRSRDNAENKGHEAAKACLDSLKTLAQIKKIQA